MEIKRRKFKICKIYKKIFKFSKKKFNKYQIIYKKNNKITNKILIVSTVKMIKINNMLINIQII